MRRIVLLALLASASAAVVGCPSRGVTESGDVRPAEWADPLPEAAGLPNLFRVDEGLLRGAQPERDGYEALRSLGVRTVVNLRPGRSEAQECDEAGLGYEEVPMRAWRVRDEDVIRFLRLATDPERQPVFVHCRRGADRAGVLVGAYRIVVQGWTREEAIREMVDGGYGFNSLWSNLVSYLERLDVERFREAAGVNGTNEAVSVQ